ncbi:MAG TPA: DEAD/DEAH box helicase [Candidatus Krumholzibacteria bacterium]|nr:DEAD/DEAH box helicase [Candidatus Krumholzibacteria bacterium]HPD72522.1 DEAD/DEAH box helicase [Candidatus Krumholzibacteria bacterium]HRY40546.1 DEAD/DEAH box helicase [Candidatus Krumholzibacteria bacterium]
MSSQHFANLGLSQSLLRAIGDAGYQIPTPIQSAAIPPALAGGDLIATAQTGTGKTAAFALPILERLSARSVKGPRAIRALVLTPTRELALQIDESLRVYGRHLRLRSTVLVGGVAQDPQVRALRQGADIVVATPGRLLDLIDQGFVALDRLETFVLDEADRMLDMGFVQAVRAIVRELPARRQTLFFSATISPAVASLASSMCRDPLTVSVAPPAAVPVNVEQRVMFVAKADKRSLLRDLLRDRGVTRALVFTRTKHGANGLARQLAQHGVNCDAIHANKSQNARQRALADFDGGLVKVLVATDIVARGIDVDGISHVINYDLPHEPEAYVHRIGRTARAGNLGVAVSLCDLEEIPLLRSIEKLTGTSLTVVDGHAYHDEAIAACSERTRTPAPAPKSRPRRGDFRSYRSAGRGRHASPR